MHKSSTHLTFPLRRAIERLRAGLSDPVAVERLTMEEESVVKSFAKGLQRLEKGQARPLCLCGSYGQGKSHSLSYLRRSALSQGYATSLIQLDVRETPFHQFALCYQALMKNLLLPTGESFVASWKKCSDSLEGMPHRFRMILQALASKSRLSVKGARVGIKPKEFDDWLGKALAGHDLPLSHLKYMLRSRGIAEYNAESLLCRGNAPYIQMVQSLGKLLHGMGFKGLVVFFDEAESITLGRLSSRVKSYALLHQLFERRGLVFPVFAFTDAFFEQVRSEEYGAEGSPLPQNYAESWQDLEVIRLQEFSSSHWNILQDRLIQLYAEAYQVDLGSAHLDIKQQMQNLLDRSNMQEMRYKLKGLIQQLDIVFTRTTS